VVRDPLGGRREASVYGRGERYVVTSGRRAGYGPTFRSPPYFVVSRSASDDELRTAVVAAVKGFTMMAELPSDEVNAAYAAELLALVGVANERTFERGASLVQIAEHRDTWTIEPWDRVRGYWVPLNEESQLSAPSAREIGEGVRSAFVTLRGRS
jgi:hypothetical protein